MSTFAACFIALYVAHHVGDYWVQTDYQAAHKGDIGRLGVLNCLAHVNSYLFTQIVALGVVTLVLHMDTSPWALLVSMLVSGSTHYAADRREHGLMVKLARLIPGKANFLELGRPRDLDVLAHDGQTFEQSVRRLDNPSLGTGAWALDQSWHLLFGVFIPALILGAWR